MINTRFLTADKAFGPGLSAGLTLVEMLVTMVMAMLLVAVGAPSFVELRQGQAQSAALTKAYGLLDFARSLAITDGESVRLCSSTNLTTCTGGTNMAQGAIVILEDDTLVRVVEPAGDSDFSMRLEGFPDPSQITFTDVGEIADLTSTASIVFCDERGADKAAAIIVNPLGMIRLAVNEDTTTIINLHTGDDATCS